LEKKSAYSVSFIGLKEGIHQFDFQFGSEFFDSFENSLIDKCRLVGSLELNKKSTHLEAQFKYNGIIETFCDRCGEDLDLKIDGHNEIIFKYSIQSESDSDDIVFIVPDETEIDTAPFFYEFISLALPSKRIHEEGQCNEEILSILEEINFQESEETDPRWDALKKLKKKDIK